MKISQYLFASLRREIALYIGNQINQYTQQDCNFYHIINEKMDAAAKPAGYTKDWDINGEKVTIGVEKV